MRRIGGCLVVLSSVVACGVVLSNRVLLDGISGSLLAWGMGEDTVYSPKYSDRGFRAVSPSMSEEEVRALLGEPMDIKELSTGSGVGWSFSRSASKNNYRIRTIRFGSDGRVFAKTADFWMD
ncbi:hypothetical protein LXT21_07205 [Myxococcus sp. K38C18041901]|uniref:hypothetical protein n=1 Tax=Myxococcus guangdongensis TaxID=2906760 RepID=UPI0020A701F3|nr:hypothetical protein [Myxococcus guangdongensis]MCP3058554.1 hypothetical protein [Myxococcus guangdongensis]